MFGGPLPGNTAKGGRCRRCRSCRQQSRPHHPPGSVLGSCQETAITTFFAGAAAPADTIEPPITRELEFAAAAVDGRADRSIRLALGVGRWLPLPGSGRTELRWQALSALGAGDLTAARVTEAHTDALAILGEAVADPQVGEIPTAEVGAGDDSTWGVFAAEGPDVRVDARQQDGRWFLTGTKPWCSLAGRLTHALVTAHTEGGRRLFAIDLRSSTVKSSDAGWIARGLADVPSGPIDLADCPAIPVGPDGWYLRRPGFAWGGIGVAACWFGGAVGLARTLRDSLAAREPDQIATMHLGAIDAELAAARALLSVTAAAVDAAAHDDAAVMAARARTVVASTAEDVLRRVGHCLGPAPLARDNRHARRVADLQLYLRQHHAERDEAALGRAVLDLPDWF